MGIRDNIENEFDLELLTNIQELYLNMVVCLVSFPKWERKGKYQTINANILFTNKSRVDQR